MSSTFKDVIQAFVSVCDLTSDSVDMIQAGGGNASAKFETDEKAMMLIKASGYLMSEVDEDKGYTIIELDKINQILSDVKNDLLAIDDEKAINLRTSEANKGVLRPSIETFLHALLPQKYILHVHALTTLIYASSIQFIDDMRPQRDKVFDTGFDASFDVLRIPYEKPGIHLAMAMMRGIEHYRERTHTIPSVIILQNHGLIVASDDPSLLYDMIVGVEDQIKSRMHLPSDFGKVYSDQRILKKALGDAMNSKRIFVRANEDRDLVSYRDGMPSFPDALVFCGLEPLVVDIVIHEHLVAALTRYIDKYGDFPKVILLNERLYFCGESIKKCLEVQDVLKIQGIIRRELGDALVSLTQEQAHALLNWEAEKYRKNL